MKKRWDEGEICKRGNREELFLDQRDRKRRKKMNRGAVNEEDDVCVSRKRRARGWKRRDYGCREKERKADENRTDHYSVNLFPL